MHARAAALLAHELLDRLEEVDVQAREVIHASELRIGGLGSVAIIADERADDGAVLLLDMGTVVLLVGAAAGEGDALALAPGIQVVVDELGAVVAVQAAQGHRQTLADVVDGGADSFLALAPDDLEVDPRGRDIDGAERVEVEALGRGAAVGDQVQFEEAGLGVGPLGKGADGDLVLEPGAGAGRREAPVREGAPKGRQEAGEGGGADLAKVLVDIGGDHHVATPSQPIEQLGEEGVPPVGADVARGLGEQLGRGGHGGAVPARAARAGATRGRARRAPQQADGRLAMQPGDRHHLVQQLVLLRPRGALVALPLHGGVLPQTGSGHRHLLGGAGNRDF